ncbi:hypothetical protein IKW73_00165 [Candidatus Saccharibacteria bacterium]|nr:hypothetical protein [Candidatus Saccharibacteria bacterium]
MGLFQIFMIMLLIALAIASIISTCKAKKDERNSVPFIATVIICMIIYWLAQGAILILATYWSGMEMADTSPKKTQEAKLSPMLGNNTYVLKDDSCFYFYADGKTWKDEYLIINYDADKAYAEAYKAKRNVYLTIDKDRKYPILTYAFGTKYIIHLENIDQIEQVNAPDLVSWD